MLVGTMECGTKIARNVETNAQRAQATGLRQAPTLKGYFFTREVCVENLVGNGKRTQAGNPPRFRMLFLETKDACNFRCPHCFEDAKFFGCGIGGVPDNCAANTRGEWKAAVRAGKGAGIETVAVAGRGEPLLDANLWKLAEFVRGQGLNFVLFTNGALVDKGAAKRLADVCTTVITKLYALEPAAHDALVGVKGAYGRTRAGLANLLDAGMRAPNLGIDVVIARQNVCETAMLLRMCRMFGIVPYFERLAKIGRGARLNGNIALAEGHADEVFLMLRGIDEKEFGLTWGFEPGMPALACAEFDKRMVAFHLDVFGNVMPGVATGQIIGNVRNVPGGIAHILEDGRRWGQYYRELNNGLEPLQNE